jgi:1-acyl-sn-glycerol-3-phosphate acyltransferase
VSGSTAKVSAAFLRAEAAAGRPTQPSFTQKLRIARRGGLLVLALIVLVPCHYLYRLVHYGSPFPKLFLRLAARICGARVIRHGVPLRRDVFFISNHVSWIDILALAGASGTAFVAKAELLRVPVVGWLATLNRTVFVEREARLAVAEQINALREALADNWSVTVFPEGTTTDGQSLLPFKTAMLRVLEPPPPGVLVQPVMLDYGARAQDIGWVGVEHGLHNALRVLAWHGTFPLHIHFLDPFDPRDFPGRKAISAESRRRIEAALVEALGQPLRAFAYDVAPVRYSAATGEAVDLVQ